MWWVCCTGKAWFWSSRELDWFLILSLLNILYNARVIYKSTRYFLRKQKQTSQDLQAKNWLSGHKIFHKHLFPGAKCPYPKAIPFYLIWMCTLLYNVWIYILRPEMNIWVTASQQWLNHNNHTLRGPLFRTVKYLRCYLTCKLTLSWSALWLLVEYTKFLGHKLKTV